MVKDNLRSKRIVKNTVFLYFRMLFLMFVTFFTSRVILQNLGVTDFGIHNVVGGLSSMFVFFRSSLANVTQRYLNIELGKDNVQGAKEVFCLHQTIYIAIAIIVVVLAEIIGVWLIYNKLVIPEERVTAAFWVFQCTIVSMAITIISVVYDSAIIAHENMKVYSYVGIYEGLTKLAIAYLIGFIGFDRLIFFQLLLVLLALSIRLYYGWYCKRNYIECSYHIFWNQEKAKEAASLVSWNTVGTVVWTINDQGINILLNVFFGPAVNAARGISFQVNHAVNTFGTSFLKSVNPQIVKSYSSGDFEYLYKLFFSSSKYSAYLLWFLCLPVMLCIDTILDLWLVEVPPYTGAFTIWVLAYSIVNILNQPIWTLSLAVGKLKYYVLMGSGVFFLAFPIAYICLRMGYSPVSVFMTMFFVRIIYIIVVFNILKQYISLSSKEYSLRVLLPVSLTVLISGSVAWMFSSLISHSIVGCLIIGIISLVVVFATIWFVGLTNSERSVVIRVVNSKFLKR